MRKLHGNKIRKPSSEVTFLGYEADVRIQWVVWAKWWRCSLALTQLGRCVPWCSPSAYRAPWEIRFSVFFPTSIIALTFSDLPSSRSSQSLAHQWDQVGLQVLEQLWSPKETKYGKVAAAKAQRRLEGSKEKMLVQPGRNDGQQVVSCPTCSPHLPPFSGSPSCGCFHMYVWFIHI